VQAAHRESLAAATQRGWHLLRAAAARAAADERLVERALATGAQSAPASEHQVSRQQDRDGQAGRWSLPPNVAPAPNTAMAARLDLVVEARQCSALELASLSRCPPRVVRAGPEVSGEHDLRLDT
jgi:hypothetical protein